MLKRTISIVLIAAVVSLSSAVQAFAGSNAQKDARVAAKVKEKIQRLGTGRSAKVTVKLKDHTSIEGYVSGAGASSFSINESATGLEREVAYSDVKSAKGKNLSTGAKIAIGVGVAIAAIAIAILANRKVCQNALCK